MRRGGKVLLYAEDVQDLIDAGRRAVNHAEPAKRGDLDYYATRLDSRCKQVQTQLDKALASSLKTNL